MLRLLFWLPAFLLFNNAEAHVKWFHQGERPPFNWLAVFSMPSLLFIVAVSLMVLGLWFWQRARGGVGFIPNLAWFGAISERRMALYGLIPAILAVHFAVPLFVASVQGNLFAPALKLPGAWAYFIGLLQAGVALALFYGGFTRAAAVVLAWLWLVGIAFVGLEASLDNAHVLGFAVFFYLAGRGPIAIDRLILTRFEPSPDLMRHAVTALRIGVGLGLIAAAFTEKLGNPMLAISFLEQQPLNFTAALGVPIPNELFLRFAGSVEFLVGLCLVANVFTREIIVIAWIPLNLTLTIFDWNELVGHLPIYGAMAVLLIWENSSTNTELWLRGLREGPLPIQ
ncbi:MAG: hypothetical protein RLZZ156_1544 [Deinococcota bacterium]|jgi:uncharacterized membrane protein YphA (DoxX/SURF4 family)